MNWTPRPIAERTGVTPDMFRTEIYPAGEPVIMRGFVAAWPAVRLASQSDAALIGHLKSRYNGARIEWLRGAPEIDGRFFYNEDLTGTNFTRNSGELGQALDLMTSNDGAAYNVQSVPTEDILPGFSAENGLSFFAPDVAPRIWIGNRVTVQTHFDLSQNIACVVAGARTFTLFPPDQLPNLYIGPIERTLAGTPVSMVRFDAYDEARFPRFREAQRHALRGELGPGDAIFIPYFWWHHVQSQSAFNVLINYWWNEFDVLGSPMHAMLHALLTIKQFPPAMKAPWRALFDQFVFSDGDENTAHLPAHARGGLGTIDAAARANLWQSLRQSINAYTSRYFGAR